MREAGSNIFFRNVVKCAVKPRGQPKVLSRTFKTTTNNDFDGVPGRDVPSLVDPVLPPPNPHAREIAILGGGLTGLATAFHLSRGLPHAKVTIYEKSNKIGGWVNSEVIKVDDGEVLFEWGPRTIRCGMGPAPMSMLELVCELGLENDLVAVPKDAPAARNRYIYYPDRLVKLPSPLKGSSLSEMFESGRTLLTDPLFEGIWKLRKEPWVPCRDEKVKDESLGDFVSRRFGKENADNLLSAVCHGIYAGDIYKLSARTLSPLLWHLETRDRDDEVGILVALLADMLNRHTIAPARILRQQQRTVLSMQTREDYLRRLPIGERFKNLSVYTFKHGLGQLTSALEQYLRKNRNITLKASSAVDEVNPLKGQSKLQVVSRAASSTVPAKYDYVVSTLNPQHLRQYSFSRAAQNLAGGMSANLAIACEHSSATVNVMVVNLYYENPNLLSIRGFGYLIPRSVPAEQNPERALGVIFGSETSGQFHALHRPTAGPFSNLWRWDEEKNRPVPAPDEIKDWDGPDYVTQDTAQGTKLTVMMGGHWWNDWTEGDLPTEQQAIEMAQSLLKRHLKIEEQPTVAKARLNRNCIPQYPVGYAQDMATVHDALSSMFQGRFKVAGPWWQGSPGMNDCVLSAREIAWAIRDQKDDFTGLQDYMKESWVVTDARTRQSKMEYTK